MADLPLLFFPTRTGVLKERKFGGGDDIRPPGRVVQKLKIENKLQAFEAMLESKRVWLQTNAISTSPNTVLVLELSKPISDFAKAAAKVGLPLIAEWEGAEFDADSEGFGVFKTKPRTNEVIQLHDQLITPRIYLNSFNLTAAAQFRTLFNKWQDGEKFEPGTKPWSHVFDCIRDIRPWDMNDRLRDTGLIEVWKDCIEDGATHFDFEADFWYRPQSAEEHKATRVNFQKLLSKINGEIEDECLIDHIGYHGVLGKIPVGAIKNFQELNKLDFFHFDEVFEFRPVTQAVSLRADEAEASLKPSESVVSNGKVPVVGVIDGMPMQNHPDLQGRVQITDPDNFEAQCLANSRVHGTAMASVILNGDLGVAQTKLQRPILMRPVLVPLPTKNGEVENFPQKKLAIDLIQRAILDLVDPGATGKATTSIKIINISLGDEKRAFLRGMSPWAKLLDWASKKYDVLFIVSAGNRKENIDIEIPQNELSDKSPIEIQNAVLKYLVNNSRKRTLFSPGEALNVITVGASHSDSTKVLKRTGIIDPIVTSNLMSPLSPIGMGYGNTIKPEVLASGGRQHYREPYSAVPGVTVSSLAPVLQNATPGVEVSAPRAAVSGASRWHMRGTSVSAALTTRLAAQIYEELEATRTGQSAIPHEYIAVILKALVTHTAEWGDEAESVLTSVLRDSGVQNLKLKENISRFLGHGCIRPDRAYKCTDQRVTVIGYGDLGYGEAHEYKFPWPQSLRSQVEKRLLTITTSSIIPTAPAAFAYRGADLWTTIRPIERRMFGLEESSRDFNAIQRGTLQHNCYYGERAGFFNDDQYLTVKVNCRAVTADEKSLDRIPYALVISLEVAEGVAIPIYSEVEVGLRTQVQVPVSTAG
jgi:hypothetical protein